MNDLRRYFPERFLDDEVVVRVLKTAALELSRSSLDNCFPVKEHLMDRIHALKLLPEHVDKAALLVEGATEAECFQLYVWARMAKLEALPDFQTQ